MLVAAATLAVVGDSVENVIARTAWHALNAWYAQWPYGEMQTGNLLQVPALCDALRHGLENLRGDVRQLLWGLEVHEYPNHSFAQPSHLEELVNNTLGPLGRVDLLRVPVHVRLPVSADIVSRQVGHEKVMHSFHIAVMHSMGALIAKYASDRSGWQAIGDFAMEHWQLESVVHGALMEVGSHIEEACWVQQSEEFHACLWDVAPLSETLCNRVQAGCAHGMGHLVLYRTIRSSGFQGPLPSFVECIYPRWLHAAFEINASQVMEAAQICERIYRARATALSCAGGVFHGAKRMSISFAKFVSAWAQRDVQFALAPSLCAPFWKHSITYTACLAQFQKLQRQTLSEQARR